ncbi:MAG: phytoene/squalene synthase family protein [Prolixibacteraceae bacterium]|nr:phytoene/squalene synthase family protein [Prolixibacteraceae bacterium]
MIELYDKNAFDCSRITTRNYSTSFSFGIRLFKKKYRPAIYSIYGFVRFADEIVDTFSHLNQEEVLNKITFDTWDAIENGFSSNPVLHSFQKTVREYDLNREYIEAFLRSMRMDLSVKNYSDDEISDYIYGSAEVVGLMCLKIFYKNRIDEFNKLIYPARKLGEAFQKINFLRDIRSDFLGNGRIYFPGINPHNFTAEQKISIENDIAFDFAEARKGISILNRDVILGVYLAYCYYMELLKIIKKTPPGDLMTKRCRVSDFTKIVLLFKAWLHYKLGKI